MAADQTPEHKSDADIIVVSDLHMGRGTNFETGRYHNLEAFFYDEDFASFCRYLCDDARARSSRFTLVLNGDVFDLVRIDPDVEAADSEIERRYGAASTPENAPRVMRQILEGHPLFVGALAQVLAQGHVVVILAGNHDIETQWPPVREVIRDAIAEALEKNAAQRNAIDGLRFRSWFHYEAGRVWIEHGCQYDPANSFHYLLRGNLTDVNSAVYAAEHDMPLGNFFQRYLYNGFGHITFIVPDASANARYVRWFLLNEPRLLTRVLISHLPFAAQVLRRISKSADPARQQLEAAHKQAIERIAESTGLGDDLYKIDGLKEARGDASQAVRTVGRQLLKTTAIGLAAVLTAVVLWFVGFLAIGELQTGYGMRALLFITLNVVMLAIAAVVVMWSLLRGGRPWRGRPLVRAAQRIVDILDVPIVAFGHTHVENVVALNRKGGERAWYFNTGTWIAVFRHDELVPRERVQYTFLRVRGSEAELVQWSPGRGQPFKVILLDEPPPLETN